VFTEGWRDAASDHNRQLDIRGFVSFPQSFQKLVFRKLTFSFFFSFADDDESNSSTNSDEGISSTNDSSNIKALFRITQESGRVTYHIIYNTGHVEKVCPRHDSFLIGQGCRGLTPSQVSPRDVYNYVSPDLVRQYEHESYAKGTNMETIYQKKHDMGGWSRGTPAAVIKKMEKLVNDTKRRANHESLETDVDGTDSSTESDDPRQMQQSRGDKRRAVKKQAQAVAVELPQTSMRRQRRLVTITDGTTPGGSSATVSSASHSTERGSFGTGSPPTKRAKTLVNVVLPLKTARVTTTSVKLSTPAKQSTLLRFFGKQQQQPASEQPPRLPPPKNGALRGTHPMRRGASSGHDTDDSASNQLKREATPKRSAARANRTSAAGQKRSRISNLSFTATASSAASSEDDLLAARAPTLLSATPQKTIGSSYRKSTQKSTSKKRAKSVEPPAEWEVERIIDNRFVNGQKQYQVKWVGFPHSDNT